jgi:hypothetical protein
MVYDLCDTKPFYIMLRIRILSTNDSDARPNDLRCRESLSLVGCTKECTLVITNDSLGDWSLARVPDFSSDNNLHVFSFVWEKATVSTSLCCYVCSLHSMW